MEMLFAAGIGMGLSSIAGVRAFPPLALVGLFAALGLFALPAPLGILGSWVVVAALLVLALLESGLDKVPALDPVLDYVQTPVRIAAGAVLFSVTGLVAGIAVLELVAGGLIAGVVAVSKTLLRPPAKVPAAGVSAAEMSATRRLTLLFSRHGAVIEESVAVSKAPVQPPAKVPAAGVSAAFLSFFEDVVALIGGVIAVFVPLVPLAFVASLLFFFYRIRKRRGKKYGGLRILGD